jgi:DNA-binding MarR family transcriptional regulator
MTKPGRNLPTPAEAPTNRVGANPVGADRADAIAEGLTGLVGVLLRMWPRETSLTADFVLDHLERVGPLRLTELAAAAGITQPSMTGLVARLCDSGLVERRRQAGDGRVVLVAVTDAGAASLDRRRTLTAQRLAQVIATLSPAELAALEAALPAVLATAARADPTGEGCG